MKWFLNLKTKIKLTLSFGSLFLLIVIMFINTNIQINTLWSNQQEQYEKDFKSVESILVTVSSLTDVRMSVLAALVSNDPAKFGSQKQKIETNIKIAFENISNCEKNIKTWGVPSLDLKLNQIQQLFLAFTQTAQNEVLPALKSDNFNGAKKLVLGIQTERSGKISVLVADLLAATQKIMEEENNSSELAYDNAVFISWVIGILAALLSFALVFLLTRLIATPLKKIVAITAQIAKGDLNVMLEKNDNKDELGMLTSGFNIMINSLKNMIQDVSETVGVLSSASIQISTSSSQLAASASETATSVTETTATVEEVRQTTNITNVKARQVAESSQRATQVSAAGKKYTDETIDGINKVGSQMETIANSIIKLSEQSRAISEIISSVNDLAEQTNLLAVNASIEAARAGEQGKGFVVVAQEIKSLADQSKLATAQVRSILNDIQNAIGSAVMATEQGSKMVEAGIKQSSQTGSSIQSIAESVNDAAQLAVQISASSQEQTVGMDQVALAMENIKYASIQNAQTTKQLEASAQNLKDMGNKLRDLIQNYKV